MVPAENKLWDNFFREIFPWKKLIIIMIIIIIIIIAIWKLNFVYIAGLQRDDSTKRFIAAGFCITFSKFSFSQMRSIWFRNTSENLPSFWKNLFISSAGNFYQTHCCKKIFSKQNSTPAREKKRLALNSLEGTKIQSKKFKPKLLTKTELELWKCNIYFRQAIASSKLVLVMSLQLRSLQS